MNQTKRYFLWLFFSALGLVGCAPGYMKAQDLAEQKQGPADCRKSCEELGMNMGAFVLIGNQLPSCVCIPREKVTKAATEGGATSAAGFVVIAAAAAAQQQHHHQQQQQQQQQQTHR